MNCDNDMAHVKSAATLVAERAAGQSATGIYGDSLGGRSFTDEEARYLERQSRTGWRSVWAGPGTTLWTIIDVRRRP